MTEPVKPIPTSAQQKWTQAEKWERVKMLNAICYSTSFSSTSWSKLSYMVRDNLARKLAKGAY
jgi:hypothetical protein